MSVSTEQVRHIAKLARIAMTDEEIERLAPELNNILGWVEQLGEVNTDGVEPLTAVIDQKLRLRDDVVNDGNIPDEILANAAVKAGADVRFGTKMVEVLWDRRQRVSGVRVQCDGVETDLHARLVVGAGHGLAGAVHGFSSSRTSRSALIRARQNRSYGCSHSCSSTSGPASRR